jgi:hypothetical protein
VFTGKLQRAHVAEKGLALKRQVAFERRLARGGGEDGISDLDDNDDQDSAIAWDLPGARAMRARRRTVQGNSTAESTAPDSEEDEDEDEDEEEDDDDDDDDDGAVAEGAGGAPAALSESQKRVARRLARVEVAALGDEPDPMALIPDASEWMLSRMVEGLLDPCEEATAKLEHGSGMTRFHRGRAWLLKRALLHRYSRGEEFWCPPKGDVRGNEVRHFCVDQYAPPF